MLELPSNADIDLACEAMPLFPLPGVVFLPHTLLPLHVFEPRYRQLVEHVLSGSRMMAVPQLAQGWELDYAGRPPLMPVCGMGVVVRHQELPDGRHNIILLGLRRARIVSEPPTDSAYRVARIALLEDRNLDRADAAALRLRTVVAQTIASQLERQSDLDRLLAPERPPDELADTVAHMILRDPDSRQAFLEEDDLLARIDLLSSHLLDRLMGTAQGEA